MSEFSLPKEHSVRKPIDTLDSLTYYQSGQHETYWYSLFKAKTLPTDVFHIVGVTTSKNVKFKGNQYFHLQSWSELRDLNNTFKDVGLWYYHRDFLRKARQLLEALSYSLDWCSWSIYYPKTLRPLLITPETIFEGERKTTPVIVISPRLSPLNKTTREYLKGLEAC